MTWYVWTHNDDRDAAFWTLRDALNLLLGYFVVGTETRRRSLAIHADLLAQLASDGAQARPEAYEGLDDLLPETDITGMGVLDAIDAVCKSAGFLLVIAPTAPPTNEVTGEPTGILPLYPYTLNVIRRNAGRLNDFKLAPRHTSYVDPETLIVSPQAVLAANDVNHVAITRDGAQVSNVILVQRAVMVQCRLDLKPLWKPDQVSEAEIDAEMMYADADLLTSSDYHQKHVVDGSLFADYESVGRVWGIDCTGLWATQGYQSPDPEDPSAYAHSEGGFDFVKYLKLNDPVGLPLLWTQQGNWFEDYFWSQRIRPAQPMADQASIDAGREFLLEVSEDAGGTWRAIEVPIAVLRDQLAIMLRIPNLAAVNAESIISGQPLGDVEDSWWALIQTQDLRFRLTCCIESDHSASYLAKAQPGSGSRAPRMSLVQIPGHELWVAPLDPSAVGASQQWTRTGMGGQERLDLSAIALRMRADHENVKLAARASTWIMDFTRFELGDRISGISGRDYSFGVGSASSGTTYPNVVGINYTLAPGQLISLVLDDFRFDEAAYIRRLGRQERRRSRS